MVRNNITEVAYNLQTTVDARHKLLLDYQVTNTNDSRALAPMVARAKSIIGRPFTVLFDKGYYNGQQIAQCHNWGIDTLVASRDTARPNGQQRVREYEIENFLYHKEKDYYECPEGQKLTTNGNTYQKGKHYRVKHYKSKACLGCKFRKLCTKSPHGRLIERSIYQENLERNRRNVEEQPARYRQRQALVEHPFGTLKRQWGYDHVLTKKTKRRASADVGLMLIAYNLRHLINILGERGALTPFMAGYKSAFRAIAALERSFKRILVTMAFYRRASLTPSY